MRTSYDVVIAGGGPAGATVASLVKKYSPELSVLLLERAEFPRHHVGESLLAGGTPVLEEMGARDAVEAYGFPEKLGASYVWGRDRTPWGFDFDNLITQLEARGERLPDVYTKGWQVRRGEYDQLLLNTAAEHGVDVRHGVRVRKVCFDGDRAVGAELTGALGERTVESTWFMDCTGQDALLGRALDLRVYDERMNNYALWGYWKGARWKVEFLGHPNLTRIFVATTPRGWIWYIPVDRDVVSVGFVTHRQTLREASAATGSNGAEALYHEEVTSCAEIDGLLDGAHLVRLTDDQRRDVCVIQDWSYNNRQVVGDGWAMAGDAAGFVDPILSSGVMLAHELGQKAAYAINSSFRAGSHAQIASYWDFYADTYRTYLKAYRDMASFWYSNNFAMESWWWEAQRNLSRTDARVDLSDRDAFVRVASGYANRAESLSLFGSYPLHEARRLVDGLFGPGKPTSADDSEPAATRSPSTPQGKALRLAERAELTEGLYFYQGLVRKTARVVVDGNSDYLDLHPGEAVLIGMLDGRHSVADLDRAAERIRGVDEHMPVRAGPELLTQLDRIGALTTT